MVTAKQLIEKLGLKPHKEGGYFTEVWRSPEKLAVNALPPRYSGSRSLSTAIYYLITPESFSRMHRLRSDEIFHFYLGDPVEMLLLGPKSAPLRGGAKKDEVPGQVMILGSDAEKGQMPMIVVRRGTWQGARLMSGRKGAFALMGTTMAPGFDYDDYEEGARKRLSEEYPEFADRICELTG
jgi:predicted cupin superfamily sugar epimerase